MSESNPNTTETPKLPFNKKQLMLASLYSLGWFTAPLIIYANKTLFSGFCSFHNKIFRLDKRNPGTIAALSVIMSIVYSSLSVPVYYNGLLKILGINRLGDLRGCITESVIQNYKTTENETGGSKQALKDFDLGLVKQIDESVGVPSEKIDDFLDRIYGDKK